MTLLAPLRGSRSGGCHDGWVEFWSDPPEERRRAALQLWSKFPARRLPRPVVLLGSRVSSGGFATGAAKEAFLSDAVDVAVDVPVGVLEALPRRRSQFSGSPITVMAANADEADFQTDRGTQRLPAWRLRITGMRTDCLVLDPAIQGGGRPAQTANDCEMRVARTGISLPTTSLSRSSLESSVATTSRRSSSPRRRPQCFTSALPPIPDCEARTSGS